MKFLTWLKGLFNKASKPMEQVLDTSEQNKAGASGIVIDNSLPLAALPSAPEAQIQPLTLAGAVSAVVSVEETVSELDATLSRVKVLLIVADHAVSDVWDDAVAYVKKSVKSESEFADKLETVLQIAGHDVSDVFKDAFAFAKKY